MIWVLSELLSILSYSSPVVVLLRFLLLVSSHSWDTDPLIINFNRTLSGLSLFTPVLFWHRGLTCCLSALSDEDIADILAQFSQRRAQLPAMVLFSSLDRSSSYWTKKTPPAILRRLVVLGQASLALLSAQLEQPPWLEAETTDFMVLGFTWPPLFLLT